jgi:ubiquinone/menaquinone biosynthesis C-methylase UbiE
MNKIISQLCPPIILQGFKALRSFAIKFQLKGKYSDKSAGGQDLNVYWDTEMAHGLETWGEGNAWNEIQFIMSSREGKVVDLACGTGKTMAILSRFPSIDVFGCDISDFLIGKALERGIKKDHLTICDATKTTYRDSHFEYAYSIGSLEHFTEDGITNFISECYRITCKSSFHMVPVSRTGRNEGWVRRNQSYYNNSVQWWLDKYKIIYANVYVLDSAWKDDISVGKWFICVK